MQRGKTRLALVAEKENKNSTGLQVLSLRNTATVTANNPMTVIALCSEHSTAKLNKMYLL